jgi:hypothetical protein
MIDGRGFVFLFNPSDTEQAVEWRQILWEPELDLSGELVGLSDWSSLGDYTLIGKQTLAHPVGQITIAPRDVKVVGINLDEAGTLRRVRAERAKIRYP